MRLAIFIILFVLVYGDSKINNNSDISLNDVERMVNISREIRVLSPKLLVVNDGIYRPPPSDHATRYQFWRNYGIRFVIGAAVSIGISLIVVVIRLYKDSKNSTDNAHRLVNHRM